MNCLHVFIWNYMGLLNTKITIYLPVVLVNSSQIKKLCVS